ncbi:MAG: alkyl hydroperoxide reductase subunit F [Xanthomonadaceae bacterium]|nr:alkyl hydroperoxide reductase subunit F [Xanthomonadaceae bacterium]
MLDANIKAQLKNYLDKLAHPVELVMSLDDSAKSREMLGLLEDIRELSDKISLRESSDAAARKPMFSVTRPGEEPRVHFAGLPMGHEFTSLVLALLHVGGHPPKVEPEVLDQIRELEGEYKFETYISLSCQNCPDVVQALNLMAVFNPNISHVMIDGALFQDEVNERQIMSVPTVYLNGEQFAQGRMGVEDFLRRLDSKAAEREAEKISAKEPFDMLIVGGGPAGASAAVYAARKGIRTGLVAERMGGQLLDTMDIENFISVPKTQGPQLAAQLEAHVKEYDIDVMTGQRAEKLVPGELLEVHLANGAVVRSRSVVLATGARWREINVPGEREYRGRGVGYCPHCDGPLFKGKPIAVIGGGNSGVEAAIDLAGIASHVTLLEFDNKLRADAVLQKKLFSLPNVRVITSAQTTEIHGDGSKVTGLTYKDRETNELHQLELDGVFIQIGLLPNTDWLKGTVELNRFGEIVVDERGQTSVPGVFAAGDVTTVPHKQIVIAVGEGAKASISAFDYLIRSSVDNSGEQEKVAASG